MDATRLKQIEEIYHAAIEIPPNERESFFKIACGEDESLRREVKSLLSFENTFDSLIDTPLKSLAAELFFERERQTNLIGREISHYKIKGLLGKGGMGEVYLADDINLNRQVALKILPPEFAADKNRMSRFVREAKSASALNHPNIITIYEIGKSEGTHFIATEFIDGKTLKEYAKRDSLNFKSALEIAIQIASALDEAHSAGIVHRDIKPDNVMIRSNGLVKILDFGIAKLLSSNNPQSLDGEAATAIKSGTTPGMIIGTANYMSPEQAKGKEVDARTDIFSFGVVLYEMMAGNLPFEGETAMEMIGAILKDEPKPLDKTEVPSEIEKIIGKCLRKDRGERYQTIKDVLIDVQDVRQDLEFQNKSERTISPEKEEPKTQIQQATTADEIQQTTTNETISGKPKSNQLLVVGLAVLLISAIGFGYWFFLRSTKQIESIAVMPFVNESGNADNEYLSDGMTESLIRSLSQIPGLNVKARSSVFRYKGKETDVQKIAQELNVLAILNGRVAQRGEQLILNLELVDGKTENVLWSEQYTRRQSDLVSLQSEIARDVSNKLRTRLSGAQQNQIAKNYTTSAEAYQLYLKGRFYWNKRTASDLRKSTEYFNQAIALDPHFALAYSGLADSYVLFSGYGAATPEESFPKAKEAAMKALDIDETLAEAHAALGYTLFNYDWNFDESEKHMKRALELNSNYSIAHNWYGNANLLSAGRFDEAIEELQKAQKIDPLSLIINADLGNSYLFARRNDQAIEQLQRTVEMDGNFYYAHAYLGRAYMMKGLFNEALLELQKAQSLSDDPRILMLMTCNYSKMGRKDKAISILDQMKDMSKKHYVSSYYFALAYTALGKKDEAFEWLEKAYREHEGRMTLIKVDPLLDGLRSDFRFEKLIEQVGLDKQTSF